MKFFHARFVSFSLFLLFAAVGFWYRYDSSVFGAGCPLRPGQPYKTTLNSSVYMVTEACTKIAIRNPDVYFSHFSSWGDVKKALRYDLERVSDDAIGFLPWGPRRVYENGTVIKRVDDPTVYLVTNGERHPIASEDVFQRLGLSWEWVEDVDSRVLEKFTEQAPISEAVDYPGALVFKYPNNPQLFILQHTATTTVQMPVQSLDHLNGRYRLDRVVTLPTSTVFAIGKAFEPKGPFVSHSRPQLPRATASSSLVVPDVGMTTSTVHATSTSNAIGATSTVQFSYGNYPLSWIITTPNSGEEPRVSSATTSTSRRTPSSVAGSYLATVGIANSFGAVPITDITSTYGYLGKFSGGLYRDATNTPPSAHHAAGLAKAANVVPRATDGTASATGKIVLMSIGFSSAQQFWCNNTNPNETTEYPSAGMVDPYSICWESFMGQVRQDLISNNPRVRASSTLMVVNGARGGMSITYWLDAQAESNFDRIQNNWLTPLGLDERQVQVIWLKFAHNLTEIGAPPSLYDTNGTTSSEVYLYQQRLGQVMRNFKNRYPNLQQVFITPRIRSFDTVANGVNNDPWAYETGFATKWLIEAQIAQMENSGTLDTEDPNQVNVGSLNYDDGTAPWISWGPYAWADKYVPRVADLGAWDRAGLSWQQSDMNSSSDITHPSPTGRMKMGRKLMDFFLNSPYTSSWFSRTGSAPAAIVPTTTPLADFDDSFSSSSTIANWTNRQQVEGGTSQYSLFDINSSTSGNFTIVPLRHAWSGPNRAPFLYKNITGNFLVETKVKARSSTSTDAAPNGTRNSAGILARSTVTTSESWVKFFLGSQLEGHQSGAARVIGTLAESQVSSTIATFKYDVTPSRTSGAFEGLLRMCRVGSYFLMLTSFDSGSTWQWTNTMYRTDLPDTLQVGLGTDAQDLPTSLQAEFDYVRGAVPTIVDDCWATL